MKKGIDMRKGLGKIRKIKKKHIFLALLAVIVLGGLAKAYSAWVGTTRIAFLNYQLLRWDRFRMPTTMR